ncbi:MAG: hypothetical protein ACJAZM_000070 [Cyclobacteriaceae bacterium]|jgi:hypothetical protein
MHPYKYCLKLFLLVLIISSCSQVGYVPLTDTSVNLAGQKMHSESQKFMRKDLRREPKRAPSGEKLQTVKIWSLKKQKRFAKRQLPSMDWCKPKKRKI